MIWKKSEKKKCVYGVVRRGRAISRSRCDVAVPGDANADREIEQRAFCALNDSLDYPLRLFHIRISLLF